jgi:hypothetical protein
MDESKAGKVCPYCEGKGYAWKLMNRFPTLIAVKSRAERLRLANRVHCATEKVTFTVGKLISSSIFAADWTPLPLPEAHLACANELRASIRSLLLPSFNRAFRRGSQTTRY